MVLTRASRPTAVRSTRSDRLESRAVVVAAQGQRANLLASRPPRQRPGGRTGGMSSARSPRDARPGTGTESPRLHRPPRVPLEYGYPVRRTGMKAGLTYERLCDQPLWQQVASGGRSEVVSERSLASVLPWLSSATVAAGAARQPRRSPGIWGRAAIGTSQRPERHLPRHGVAQQTATDRQAEDPEVVAEHEHAFETHAYVSRTTSTGAWSLRPRSAATSVRTRHDFTAAAVLVSAYRWSSMNGRLFGLKYVRTSSAEWR